MDWLEYFTKEMGKRGFASLKEMEEGLFVGGPEYSAFECLCENIVYEKELSTTVEQDKYSATIFCGKMQIKDPKEQGIGVAHQVGLFAYLPSATIETQVEILGEGAYIMFADEIPSILPTTLYRSLEMPQPLERQALDPKGTIDSLMDAYATMARAMQAGSN